jgi:N-acetylneuraminic acid mutarotase
MWGDKMVIYGGFVEGYRSSETIMYDFKTRKWENVEPKSNVIPEPRAGHSCSIYNDGLYVFGGKDDDNNKLNDLWCFDLKSYIWKEIKVENPPIVLLLTKTSR